MTHRDQSDSADIVERLAAVGVYATSAAMQAVLREIEEAAAGQQSILICGEAGAGRGHVARAIHALRGLPPDSFVALDCRAARGGDVEARLFRTEGGLRPAARRPEESLAADSPVLQALGGTLYLANITDAPSLVQLRLMRLVRDRAAIAPDGSRVAITCRFAASVEPDFETALEERRYRRELHARFATILIRVPPLRERPEDIPRLAQFFLARHARRSGGEVKQLTAPALMLLQALPWPGNALELRDLVESLAQWNLGGDIDLADVLSAVRLDPRARTVAVGGSLRAARRRFEREYIFAVLQQFDGRIPAAARALGIQRANLYRKMRSLNIAAPGPTAPRQVMLARPKQTVNSMREQGASPRPNARRKD
ncbi:MAG: sigma-54-dependent transcriptional regulator [Bacteroidales bacterium]